MSKKKLAIMITSLCLVVVAAVAAVVAVLAAANIGINSNLNVSYNPVGAVYADVESFYKKGASGTKTAIGSKQSFNYGTSSSTGAAISPSAIALNDTDTYVVFCFSFKNTVNESQNPNSKYLTVGVTNNGAASNMDVVVRFTTTALADANLTYAAVSALSATDTTGTTLAKMAAGTTGYMYVAVQRQEGIKGSYGTKSGSSTTFAFALSVSAS